VIDQKPFELWFGSSRHGCSPKVEVNTLICINFRFMSAADARKHEAEARHDRKQE
jgi:hypothetical protein